MTDLSEMLPPIDQPIKVEHPLVHKSGVFFGLSDDEYHAAFALSASGIKNMRVSTLNFWANSPLNPDKEEEKEEESFAKMLGKAFHKRILEGRPAFQGAYAPAVEIEHYPGALKTNDELKARCEALGLKVGGNKAALISRIAAASPVDAGYIWENIIAEHEAQYPGRAFLKEKLIRSIEIAAKMIESHPDLGRAFTGGMSEVSVFYVDEETGVPIKVRFDYLKPKAIVDLKTFENVMGMPVDRAIARAMAGMKYHIQAALYLQGGNAARKLISAGEVNGKADQAFLDALIMADERTFLFVFQQKGIAPVAKGKILAPGITLDLGRYEVAMAKANFARCWKTFGTDPWVDTSGIETFDSSEFPAYIAD